MASRSRTPRLPPVRRKLPPRAPPKRRRSKRPKKPELAIYSILAWGDEHHRRVGKWPTPYSGVVRAAPWETWRAIDSALRHGYRGCRPGNSLALIFHRHRGRPLPLPRPRPRLLIRQIVAWADAHHLQTGRWPAQQTTGTVAAGRPETWRAVDLALRKGTRGLPGGDSLARVLWRYRGVRRARNRPRLTVEQVLAWADAYFARHGAWPHLYSGKIAGKQESWNAVHSALERGGRGLPRGCTLAGLLEKHRGARYSKQLPSYTERQILAWADQHERSHGTWPTLYSGAIPAAPGETWRKVEGALCKGQRGLPGGESLSQLLMRHGRRPFRDWRRRVVRKTRLNPTLILGWADAYYRNQGRWPAVQSGAIKGVPDESWKSVDNALRMGVRGLTGKSSLAQLLEARRGLRHKHHRVRFTNRNLLAWADAFHRRCGTWPKSNSGPIPESPGDTWQTVDSAMNKGTRGRPGHQTLFFFLLRHGRYDPDDWRVQRVRRTATGARGAARPRRAAHSAS